MEFTLLVLGITVGDDATAIFFVVEIGEHVVVGVDGPLIVLMENDLGGGTRFIVLLALSLPVDCFFASELLWSYADQCRYATPAARALVTAVDTLGSGTHLRERLDRSELRS